MKRRNIELALLCFAAPLVILLFAMIIVNQGQHVSLESLAVPLGIFVSFVLAHIAIRRYTPDADPAILPITFALSGIGIAFITRIHPELAMNQVLWLFLGIILMIAFIAGVRSITSLVHYKYTFMILGLVFLLSPLIPGLGQEIYGSRIWIHLGPFSFQPGEIAKICIVLFLAGYLSQNREMLSVFTQKIGPFSVPDLRTIAPLATMWALAFLIVVFEKDLGSALVFFLVFLTMLYTATGKKFYVLIGLGLAALGGVCAWALFGHVQVRVATWLDPFADPLNTGYQLVQTIYALADGNLFGVGIGRGMAGDIIPVVESDFIFACIAEETGLLGAAGLLLLYLCFAIRGLTTAARAKSDVASFIATGLTATIILQAFIIVGGVTRLIPLTGLTLPFISQGGSSLLASFIAVGFLLSCGNEGTGYGAEMEQGTRLRASEESVLGRVALGKRLTSTVCIFSILFALLVANLTWVMVVQADYYQGLPGNNHTLARETNTERGTISTYDGVVLARSVPDEAGGFTREYPAGNLASHVIGYTSARFGTAGLEHSYNDTLQGNRNFATWTDVINNAAGIGTSGNDIRLTINSDIQRAAQDALKGHTGACVVIDPRTGAILALASAPTYDAQEAEQLLSKAVDQSDTSGVMLNRATQALYAPGSTFKILCLATALSDNIANENTVYSSPAEMDLGGGKITNYKKQGFGDITLKRATELSSNTAFAQLGEQIGSKALVEAAEAYGFNKPLGLDTPTAQSLMPNPEEMTLWETAWAACGQPVGEHESPAGPQATVVQMAMIGQAIANNGIIQKPYLVDSIYNAQGERSFATIPQVYSAPITDSIAARTKEVLLGVVENGTGQGASLPNVLVAGKTGTAETGKPHDDSWFVGLAPYDKPTVVVALVIEQGADTGGNAPILSRGVFEAALKAGKRS